MARVVKFFKVVRNNWKKSVFFTGVAAYGVQWGRRKYDESVLRTIYCTQAQKYGDVPLVLGDRPKRVTVFLNPAAKNGKSKKLFDKNVAPILHLAGFEVTLVKTEYEGQAKKYMDVVEKTDAIIVAGGDGTVLEVVTGLLRRADSENWWDCTLGIIPLGYTNTLAQTLFYRGESDVRWLLESAMAVVLNKTKNVDVMAIKGSEDRTVYALSSLQWGPYRDAEAKKKKYWYFGGLKHYWAYVRETMKTWPPQLVASLTYEKPCDGCSRCYSPPPEPVWRWWHFLLPPKREIPKFDYSKIDNPDCGVSYEQRLNSTEFSCATQNSEEEEVTQNQEDPVENALLPKDLQEPDRTPKHLELQLGPKDLSKSEFISNGWNRIKGKAGAEKNERLNVQKFVLLPEIEEGKESWFTIDNEEFEAMPVEVSLLKDRIRVFCGLKMPSLLTQGTS